jgi:hypothetical protein
VRSSAETAVGENVKTRASAAPRYLHIFMFLPCAGGFVLHRAR